MLFFTFQCSLIHLIHLCHWSTWKFNDVCCRYYICYLSPTTYGSYWWLHMSPVVKFSQAPSKHTSRLSLGWCPNMLFLNTVHEQIKVEQFFSRLGLVARLRFCSTGCRLSGNFARAKICYHKWYPAATQPLRVFAKVVVARCLVSLLVNYTCYALKCKCTQMTGVSQQCRLQVLHGIAAAQFVPGMPEAAWQHIALAHRRHCVAFPIILTQEVKC